MNQVSLCNQLWQTFNQLKSSYEEAKKFLDEGENLSLQQYTEAHATLRKAFDDYQKSLYVDIDGIGEIFALDYLSLEQLCQINNLSFKEILAKQEDGFVENRRIVKLEISYTKVSDLTPLKNVFALQSVFFTHTYVSDLSPLKDLSRLHYLSCLSTHVSDLSYVQHVKTVIASSCPLSESSKTIAKQKGWSI